MSKQYKQSDFSDLAVVCCYFNPCHYRSRRVNYDHFERGIRQTGIKLLTVELAFADDQFELSASEDLIQIRTPHVMWQKERLLNIAIESLPDKYQKVAWFDCDILWSSKDWPAKLSALLDRKVFVQCFKDFVLLPPEQNEPKILGPKKFGSVFYYLECKRMERGHSGYAWAARRELLTKHGLYDAHILGAADLSMSMALYGSENLIYWVQQMNLWPWYSSMNIEMSMHLENWLLPFAEDIKGKSAYLDETVFVLNHGNLSDRFYGERSRILKDFSPFNDIVIGKNKCWHWNTPKVELHRNVREYFNLRNEDSNFQEG